MNSTKILGTNDVTCYNFVSTLEGVAIIIMESIFLSSTMTANEKTTNLMSPKPLNGSSTDYDH